MQKEDMGSEKEVKSVNGGFEFEPVTFDRDAGTGDLQYCLEGGHDRPRILHTGDQTGKAIMLQLNDALKRHPNITLLENKMVFDLVINENDHEGKKTCTGA